MTDLIVPVVAGVNEKEYDTLVALTWLFDTDQLMLVKVAAPAGLMGSTSSAAMAPRVSGSPSRDLQDLPFVEVVFENDGFAQDEMSRTNLPGSRFEKGTPDVSEETPFLSMMWIHQMRRARTTSCAFVAC